MRIQCVIDFIDKNIFFYFKFYQFLKNNSIISQIIDFIRLFLDLH
jgi:hypothetical protein